MSKTRKVFKYGTGESIPERAIYLSTQVETTTEYFHKTNQKETIITGKETLNKYVWHYFLVEVNE